MLTPSCLYACRLRLSQAGISEHAVMFPIDSIKVRFRPWGKPATSSFEPAAPDAAALLTAPLPLFQTRMQVIPITPTSAYNTLYSSLTRVATTDGLRTLWKGVNSVIMGAGPAHAVYFGTYEIVKDLAGGNRPGHQFAATGECFLFREIRLAEPRSSSRPAQRR